MGKKSRAPYVLLRADLLIALLVAILFSLSYFFVFNKFIGVAFFFCALIIFGFLLIQKRYFATFWTLIFLVLLQNVNYGLCSTFSELFFGKEHVIEAVLANKNWSFLLLEGKFIFAAIWCVWIGLTDLIGALKAKQVSLVRFVVYTLAIVLCLLSAGTVFSIDFGTFANTRSYLSLLSVLLIGNFLGETYSNQITAYFPRRIILPLALGLSLFNAMSDLLLRSNIIVGNETFGVHYLYFAKLFFATATPLYLTAGRFVTVIFGTSFPRSGGIFFEPVNYGFLLVFLSIICGYYYFQTRKNIDLFAFLASLFFLMLNLGKGALLTAGIIVHVYFCAKIFPSRSKKIFALAFTTIIIVIFGVLYSAPIISSSTEGHLGPFFRFLTSNLHTISSLLIGNGIGTAGNFVKDASFVESAFVVILSELGLLWYLLYQGIVITLAFKAFTNTKLHPLLASFAVVGLLNVLIAGTFQENVFSLQIGVFTVLLGTILSSNSRPKPALHTPRANGAHVP